MATHRAGSGAARMTTTPARSRRGPSRRADGSAGTRGLTFDQLRADPGLSRKVLTERLNHLVEHGVLERRPYDSRPRYEYHLTESGTELVDLLPGPGAAA